MCPKFCGSGQGEVVGKQQVQMLVELIETPEILINLSMKYRVGLEVGWPAWTLEHSPAIHPFLESPKRYNTANDTSKSL